MGEPYTIKTSGYLISTSSVILLGIPAWKNASTNPLMLACLIGGMLASMAGMALRWWSYRLEKSKPNPAAHIARTPRKSPAL